MKIVNCKLKISIQGFTLVEALVSATVIAIIGLSIANLLSKTFQSNTKTQLLGSIKRNGTAALNYLDQSIRGATTLICVGNADTTTTTPPDDAQTTGDTLVISNSVDNVTSYTRFRFETLDTSSRTNGNVFLDHPLTNDPSLCGDNSASFIQPLKLIDTDQTTGVAVKTPPTNNFFAVNRNAGAKPSVTITFYLVPGLSSSNRPEENIADPNGQLFQTTVQLR